MSKPAWGHTARATRRTIFVGFDPREAAAYAVARHSIERRVRQPIRVQGLVLDHLRAAGIYTRPHEVKDGRAWCPISEAPISTEFANSRFLVPHMAQSGLAVFMDCDMLVRKDISEMFNEFDDSKAVMVVKHDYQPKETTKMDGQVQTRYFRKNWSSVMIFNVNHPANRALTLEMVNSVPGRDLHRFCWLADDEIGELHPKWNYLVGHSDPSIDPAIVHFTEGSPFMPGYENCEYSDEWHSELSRWAL